MGRRKSRGKTLKRAGNSDERTALTSGGSVPGPPAECLSALNCKMGRGGACLPASVTCSEDCETVSGEAGGGWKAGAEVVDQLERAWRGLTAAEFSAGQRAGSGGLAPSSPSQVSICSTRLLALRPRRVMSEYAVAEAQTLMAAPRFCLRPPHPRAAGSFRRLAVQSLGSSSGPG